MDNNVEVAKIAKKIRMDDKQIFGITELKLQAFSLAALEMSLGDIVVKAKFNENSKSCHFSNNVP